MGTARHRALSALPPPPAPGAGSEQRWRGMAGQRRVPPRCHQRCAQLLTGDTGGSVAGREPRMSLSRGGPGYQGAGRALGAMARMSPAWGHSVEKPGWVDGCGCGQGHPKIGGTAGTAARAVPGPGVPSRFWSPVSLPVWPRARSDAEPALWALTGRGRKRGKTE